MTGTEFSTAVEEINGGDPIASTLRFQFGNLGKNLIEQRRRGDDSPQGLVQDGYDGQHLAKCHRSFDDQRVQSVASDASGPIPDPAF